MNICAEEKADDTKEREMSMSVQSLVVSRRDKATQMSLEEMLTQIMRNLTLYTHYSIFSSIHMNVFHCFCRKIMDHYTPILISLDTYCMRIYLINQQYTKAPLFDHLTYYII